jgi:phosphate transport system substrate-binding protein
MLTRALSDKEGDLTSYPVARDGVCVIVHKDNPVTALSSQQVVDILAGRIINWNKVGGSNAGIDVINGVSGSGTVDIFLQYYKIKYEEIKPRTVLRSSSDRTNAVAENRNAISFASIGEAERKMKAGVPIKLLPAEGVLATARTLRSGNYPIARPLTLITSDTVNELTRGFIRYALSPSVTGIIVKHDFVPYQD